jgi:regulator of cell morphogenesis and NO signaling
MNQAKFIDVTKIEPRLKHATIFSEFDQLPDGQAIMIHNDHDPKPLYYQFLGERGNVFTWNYKENGPVVWEVEITKKLQNSKEDTIGKIVSSDIRKAEVFKKLGIDFCCGGKKTLAAACMEKGLDVLAVKEELEKTTIDNAPAQTDYNDWTLSFLADYIVNVHHNYIRKNAPVILELAEKVATRHGKGHSELNEIKDKVNAAMRELDIHMKKEEFVLFPYIKQIEASKSSGHKPTGFDSVMQPISVMENDHDLVGDLFRDISALSNNYKTPENACNSYSLFYFKLQEFENDLHTHIHLENNILFPRAVELEKES